MKLYIKFMMSFRYKYIVRDVLNGIGIPFTSIKLGEVEIDKPISFQQKEQLKIVLLESGLELIEDRTSILIEKIKHVVIRMIYYSADNPTLKFSDYLSEKLHYDYTYLSNIFSENHHTTIEHFIIFHRIERAKELLIDHNKSIGEIANILHYNNISHLSNQFKKVTGKTPSFFKLNSVDRV